MVELVRRQWSRAGHDAHERWWSSRRTRAATFVVAALALELLPVEGTLLLITGAQAIGIGDAPAPLWYLAGMLLLAWALGRWLRRRASGRLGLGRSFALTFPLLFLSYGLLVRVSPSVYGSIPGGLLAADSAAAERTIPTLLNLFLLVVYLWYRGLVLGTRSISHDDVMRRFKVGMVVLIAASALLASTPARQRTPLVGVFSLFLPIEVFFGLLASALARLAIPRGASDNTGRGDNSAWIGLAVLLAWLVVGVALLVAFAVNAQGLSAALQLLGPVGAAVGGAVRWLIDGFSQLLTHIFGGGHTERSTQLSSRPDRGPTNCAPGNCSRRSSPSLFDLVFLRLPAVYALILCAFLLLGVAIFGSALLDRLLSPRAVVGDESADEERESLAGGSLFRQQLRDLFTRRRRRPTVAEDFLAAGSVRVLYRDVLRAASEGGLPRAAAETPDEYAARLASAAPLVRDASGAAQDLAALSAAYDDARYGEQEPDPVARATLRDRARRLIVRLRR